MHLNLWPNISHPLLLLQFLLNYEIQIPTPSSSKTLKAIDYSSPNDQFPEIPKSNDLPIICFPNVDTTLPNTSNINMSEAEGDPATDANDSQPSVDSIPNEFENMKTIDVVRTILGKDVPAPKPYQVLPLGDPSNPLDCDRILILLALSGIY